MKTKEAAAVPSWVERPGLDFNELSDVLIRIPTHRSEIPCPINDMRSDLIRPNRSMTRAAAAVPKIPKVLTRPASQADL